MNVKRKLTCAAPTQTKWGGINWADHESVVKKLQVRIAKAVQERRFGKVKSLQRLLTSSYSAKLLAVRKVTQNKGKDTPGVDGEILQYPYQKLAMVARLKRRNYKPKPLRRVYIKKKNGKQRPLSIPTILDRCMQQLYYTAISPISESTSDGDSYGFRPERNCADAIEQCFTILSRRNSPKWIFEGDIKGCFDNINHEWMLNNICIDKTVLSKWLKAGYIETKRLFPTVMGSPQGGIISPCLSNFVLDGIDKILDDNFKRYRPGIKFVRYADDFIITAPTKEILEGKIKPLLTAFLKERGLELSVDKTKITHIDEGFDFLGQNIRKYPVEEVREKLLIKPSKDSIKSFLKRIREIIRNSGSMTKAQLISKINPKIRGWINYHKSVVSKRAFHKIDHEIWYALWKWALRRHPHKGKRWVKNQYFTQKGLRNYCFIAKEKQRDGKMKEITLIKAIDTPIVRHVKIRKNANIYNPIDEEYFERRRSTKIKNSSTAIKRLIPIFRKQGYRCVCCGENIFFGSKWIIHLIKSSLQGGDYKNSNLIIIHDKCHREGFKSGFVYTLPVTLEKRN